MTLKGENIYLRELSLDDANGNYPNWFNDPIICKYNSHGDILYTKEMAKEYINHVSISSEYAVFAICDIKSDIHIGNISLQQISQRNKSAEFAILIGERNFLGRGLSKEAGKIILKYAFENMNLHRVYCGTSIYNQAMQKLAISLGMKQEGIKKEAMFKANEFVDIIEYAIINNN